MNDKVKSIFSHRKFWAARFGPGKFLPMSLREMDELGWDSCDVILVTGDAYVDHPSFGAALIGRLLEAQGFRVGIIAQPGWKDTKDFKRLGRPNLFFGVTAGNMDSMVNRYTADRKIRKDDAYSPNGIAGKRPDRSSLVYAQRCKEAYKKVPVILGGIEASLRRLAHYDYWQDKVRRSILLDAKADMLLYGNAERAIVELAHQLARGKKINQIKELRGSLWCGTLSQEQLESEGFSIIDKTRLEDGLTAKVKSHAKTLIKIPGFPEIKQDKLLYAHASRVFHHETNPFNARTIIQQYGSRTLWVNPPPLPLSTRDLDKIYELPYSRAPHPVYKDSKIPAFEMIKHSVNIMRGCFGGCTFCSITEHEGRIIQNRSEESVLREIETIRDTDTNFTGQVSDLGGPTANMYRLKCKSEKIEKACRRLSCVYPVICKNLDTNHKYLVNLYKKARKLPGIKKISIASGVRYDLALTSPEYVKELVQHHVGGYLKIAPEHTEAKPLALMMKPRIDSFFKFKQLFDRFSRQAGKEQYLIPYFIAAHPGSTDEDMLNLSLWLKENNFRLDQVQTFLPTPMALATVMYHSELNPLKQIKSRSEKVYVAKGLKARQLQKAFIRYHARENAPILAKALTNMGHRKLIGYGKKHLVKPT